MCYIHSDLNRQRLWMTSYQIIGFLGKEFGKRNDSQEILESWRRDSEPTPIPLLLPSLFFHNTHHNWALMEKSATTGNICLIIN